MNDLPGAGGVRIRGCRSIRKGYIMKFAFMVGALIAAFPTLAIAGEKVDMAELTCKQFLADEEGILPTVVWIDGYLSHQSGNTVIDMDRLIANGKRITGECASQPDMKIMDLVPEEEWPPASE